MADDGSDSDRDREPGQKGEGEKGFPVHVVFVRSSNVTWCMPEKATRKTSVRSRHGTLIDGDGREATRFESEGGLVKVVVSVLAVEAGWFALLGYLGLRLLA